MIIQRFDAVGWATGRAHLAAFWIYSTLCRVSEHTLRIAAGPGT